MKHKIFNKLYLIALMIIVFITASPLSINGLSTTKSDSMISVQSYENVFYEYEPNDNIGLADYSGYFEFEKDTFYTYGMIDDAYNDKDYYYFETYSTGDILIQAFWTGTWSDLGFEDDLSIILYDQNGQLYSYSSYNNDYRYSQYVFANIPAGTWYYKIQVRNNEYTYLYSNEDYEIELTFEQTSKPLSMFIEELPYKVNYLYGEVLDLTGGYAGVLFDDGSIGYLDLVNVPVTGYNIYGSFGQQTVTVRWNEFETSFNVYLNRFIDVPYGHRNYNHINALVELGIINGYSDSTFRPNNTLTRAQAAIMIARAIGLSTEGVSSNFTDVPSTHAAYKFISAAQNAGIINGYSDGTFRPNASITRAQIAIMVQRAFQVQASGTVMSFTDVPVGYAPKSFIEILASQKIVNGYSDSTFKPTNNVTRAQFSTMINNAIEYSKKR